MRTLRRDTEDDRCRRTKAERINRINKINRINRVKKRRKRRKRIKNIFVSAVFIMMIFFGAKVLWPYLCGIELDTASIKRAAEGIFDDHGGGAADFGGEQEEKSINVSLDGIYSPYAVLLDEKTGETIASLNSTERIYPASMTKIMTALVTIENTSDLDREINMPDDIFGPLYAQNASMAGFQPGERATIRELLYGMLLPSGAECCLAAAEDIAGSEDAFVNMMNGKAEELGMNDTHFVNTTGLQDPDHYSTVRDMAVLLRYALQDDDFRQIFTSSRYSTFPTDEHPDGFTFYSTVLSNLDGSEIKNGEILGGKSGYTEEAGLCLASLGEVNGREYILVTAGAAGDHQTEQYHILDAIEIYDRIGEQG